MEDLYRTVEVVAEGLYKEKGSKFLAFVYPVATEEQIREIITGIKEKYYDARHHCYAWRLGAAKTHFRMNDDGEPSSTAGKPIFGQIQSFDLTNVLIVVVRYFGGTKLGKVEPLSSKEFRQQRISVLDHTAVIFTARTAIDHFFHLCEELRVAIPETMKYFCMTEAIAVYLQKYIVYRKRKIFYGQTGKADDLVTVIAKHAKEKYLVPVSDVHKDDLFALLVRRYFHMPRLHVGLTDHIE